LEWLLALALYNYITLEMAQNPRPGGDFLPFFPGAQLLYSVAKRWVPHIPTIRKFQQTPFGWGLGQFRVPFIWGVGGLGDTGPVPCSNTVKSSWTDRYASSKINDVPWAKIMGHIWR
jgi:hypothetical protein